MHEWCLKSGVIQGNGHIKSIHRWNSLPRRIRTKILEIPGRKNSRRRRGKRLQIEYSAENQDETRPVHHQASQPAVPLDKSGQITILPVASVAVAMVTHFFQPARTSSNRFFWLPEFPKFAQPHSSFIDFVLFCCFCLLLRRNECSCENKENGDWWWKAHDSSLLSIWIVAVVQKMGLFF